MRCPERFKALCSGTLMYVMFLCLLLVPGYAGAGDDAAALRAQLEEQRALIREQSELLKQQQQKIDQQSKDLESLSRRLDQMEQSGAVAVSQPAAQPRTVQAEAAPAGGKQLEPIERDSVGDMNAAAVQAGDFPGSFRLPGSGNISLAIGGFIKTAVIYDSKAEKMGADFLPATLGTRRSDKEGATSVDVTLTRLFFDGRAPVPGGQVRGYVEYDLNSANDGTADFKIRHAYGTWKNKYGVVTAGHTWSTAMDLKILPEGLTEPTVSGVIFQRQALVRWSQPLGQGFTLHAAAEDPNSSDVFSTLQVNNQTSVPDVVLGLDYDHAGDWHLRFNGITRNLKTDLPEGGTDSATGWGVTLSGHVNFLKKDKLRFSGVYGEGLGRYLLGIQSNAGSALNPSENVIDLRKNWGVMAAYEHHWTDILRSTVMGGYAHSKPLGWQSDDTFENSTYASVNLMWNVYRYITLGVEYAYGRRENKDNSDLDNHRIAVGMQFY